MHENDGRDTGPFRGRALPAYADCMTVALAQPIDSVYSSEPSHRSGLWLRWETLFSWSSWSPWSREAGHGLGNTPDQGDQEGQIDGQVYSWPATKESGIQGDWSSWSGLRGKG